MNERPTLEAVKAAIKAALVEGNNSDRKTASEWLDKLKASPFAWEICDQLLLERESIEICYLAAHMLRHKIYKNFNELPLECYTSLKDSILNHLKSNEDHAVLGQLTMAISDMTLLLKSWHNPIEELASKLNLDQPLSNYDDINRALHHRIIFADILHQMCDLNHNHSDRPTWVGSKRREEFEDYLISKCRQAITWWLSTMKEIEDLYIAAPQHLMTDPKCMTTVEKLIGQIYLCFSAWLRIFDEENMNDSLPILDSAFKHLKQQNCTDRLHNYAVEVIISTANYAEDSALEYMITHLVNQVCTLESDFWLSVTNEDAAKSCNFARVFSAVGEVGCQKYIIDEKDFRLLELLLNCMNHYDFEIVQETYHFWWMFLDLLQVKLKVEDYIPYMPYINRFIMSVTKLCQFDPDEDSVISSDQDIHSFRIDSAEIIYSVLMVTEVQTFLRDNQIIDNFRVPLTNISWEKLESLLFLTSCLNQMLTDKDNQIRMELFKLIMSQQISPSNPEQVIQAWPAINFSINIGSQPGQVHPQIIATTLQVIGTLDGLLDVVPECLSIATNYILTAMNNQTHGKQLMEYAAASLAQILEVSASRHFGNCTNLLEIIRNICTNLDQYESASSDLLKSAVLLAAAINDSNTCDQFLSEILSHNINIIATTISSPSSGDEATNPVKYMERLSQFFKHLTVSQDKINGLKNFINLIDTTLWPVILKVLENKSFSNEKTIERTCRTIRYLIRCIKPEWMIQRVADTMINLYKSFPQNSSPLYICSILVDVFANRTPEINAGLFQMLEIFCQLTFTLLNLNASQQQSLLSMKTYPETIDDMMRLFNRFLEKCPEEFLACSALGNIIELSISSLRIDHLEANPNVTKFITSFIETSKKHPHIKDAIQNVLGARITDSVIKACLLDVPSSLVPDEAQILVTLRSFDNNLFRLWVEESVKSLPRANIQGIESVTEDQLNEFKTTITSSDSLKGLVNCLRAFARQYN